MSGLNSNLTFKNRTVNNIKILNELNTKLNQQNFQTNVNTKSNEEKKNNKKNQNPLISNKGKAQIKSVQEELKKTATGFFSQTKKAGNSVKGTFVAIDPVMTGYKNSTNYNALLQNFKIIKNKNNTNTTDEENNGFNKSSKSINEIITNFWVNNKSLKKRKNDEIVKGFYKLSNFSKEIDNHVKQIRENIKKYNNLEVQNKKYYEKIEEYLAVIKKKDSHGNSHYQKKLFTSKQAKEHNEQKRGQSVKYAQFYLFKIFDNLYKIIRIKYDIKINISIIQKLLSNRSDEIIKGYLDNINKDIEFYTDEYEKYIEDYEDMKYMIINKNKEKKIPKVHNYYNNHINN